MATLAVQKFQGPQITFNVKHGLSMVCLVAKEEAAEARLLKYKKITKEMLSF